MKKFILLAILACMPVMGFCDEFVTYKLVKKEDAQIFMQISNENGFDIIDIIPVNGSYIFKCVYYN